MSQIEDYIGARLQHATVTALVPAARIASGRLPQSAKALPCVNYFQVTLTPFVNGAAVTYDMQVSARARTVRAAKAIADAITGQLVGRVADVAGGFAVEKVELGSQAVLDEAEIDAYHVATTLRVVTLSASIT